MARRRRKPVTPGALLRDGLDWTGRTGRGRFALVAALVALPWAAWRGGPLVVDGWTRWHEAAAAVPLAAMLVPAAGHAVRRLHDAGRGGGAAWLLAVPWVRWGLVLALLLAPASQRRPRAGAGGIAAGMGAAALAALLVLGSLAWTAAPVLAGGMKPLLLPGDLLLLRRAPIAVAPGDVVAFRLTDGEAARVGRVVAGGGARVAVRGGVPVVDGAAARRERDGHFVEAFGRQGPLGVMPVCGNGAVGLGAECRTERWRETLPGGAGFAVLDAGPRPLDEAAAVEVPPGRLYVLGDHRDEARDSRLAPAAGGAGLVPEAAVLGRAVLVIASADGPAWDPRGWRWGRLLGRVR